MATVALLPDLAPPILVENPAQGTEGRYLERQARKVWRHWKQPSELVFGADSGEADEITYQSVPREKAFSIQVKYRYVGEMKPKPFPLND
jgi:hypothetical protein